MDVQLGHKHVRHLGTGVLVLAAALAISCSGADVREPAASAASSPTAGTTAARAGDQDESPRPAVRGSSEVSEVIATSGRPSSGTVARDGTALLTWTQQPRERARRRQPAAFRVFDRRGVAIAQGLVRRPLHSSRYWVYADAHGFLLLEPYYRQAWYVTRAGRVTEVAFDGPPTAPEPGDVLVAGAADGGWVFRPSTRRIHRRVLGPPGASVTHVDGRGVWWALGEPEEGQTVLFSAAPGQPWTRHIVGVFSDPDNGCVCSASPGPDGRGPVITVVGDSIAHVSLDHGRTWRTWDISGTRPDRVIRSQQRFPRIAALPDGRLVVGYMLSWVAKDASNNSFVRLPARPTAEEWLAGMTDELLTRPGAVSADGGETWLRVS